jgi:uncharacterized membrane protein YphA (DoxX/SURF4 family)
MVTAEDKYFSKKYQIVTLFIRALFGIIFLVSATTKLVDLPSFESSIKKFAIIPDYFAGIIGYAIPIIELILGFQVAYVMEVEVIFVWKMMVLLIMAHQLVVIKVSSNNFRVK